MLRGTGGGGSTEKDDKKKKSSWSRSYEAAAKKAASTGSSSGYVPGGSGGYAPTKKNVRAQGTSKPRTQSRSLIDGLNSKQKGLGSIGGNTPDKQDVTGKGVVSGSSYGANSNRTTFSDIRDAGAKNVEASKTSNLKSDKMGMSYAQTVQSAGMNARGNNAINNSKISDANSARDSYMNNTGNSALERQMAKAEAMGMKIDKDAYRAKYGNSNEANEDINSANNMPNQFTPGNTTRREDTSSGGSNNNSRREDVGGGSQEDVTANGDSTVYKGNTDSAPNSEIADRHETFEPSLDPTVDPRSDSGQNSMSSAVNNTASVVDNVGALGQELAGMSDEHAMAVAGQYNQMVAMLDSLESQIMGQIRGQMNGDDPQLQNAINMLKEEFSSMEQNLLEDLNARGLVTSGVYAEALGQMKKGQQSEVQSMISGRFGELQNQLNNAVMQLAGMRINALQGNHDSVNKINSDALQTQAQVGLKGAELGLQQRGQDLNQIQHNDQMKYNYYNTNLSDNTQRYGIDTNYQATQDTIQSNESMNTARINSNESINSNNISAANQRAQWSNANSLKIADKNNAYRENAYNLDQEKFNYAKSQEESAKIQSDFDQVTNRVVPQMSQQIKNNQMTVAEAQTQLERMGVHPEVIQHALYELNKITPDAPRDPKNPYTIKDSFGTTNGMGTWGSNY